MHRSVSPQRRSHSLKKISVSPKKECLEVRARREREKLCHSLDTYTLLVRSGQPIRCLEHNSNISVYCETEQRLLCASCIFGRNEHKYHRVIPVDKAYALLEKDIDTMHRLIEREIATMTKIDQLINQTVSFEEASLDTLLTEVTEKYSQCHFFLDQCFINIKQNIIHHLDIIRTKYEVLKLQNKFMVDTYATHLATTTIANNNSANTISELLFKHMVSHKIASLKKVDEKEWISGKAEIKQIGLTESKKIDIIFETIKHYSNRIQ